MTLTGCNPRLCMHGKFDYMLSALSRTERPHVCEWNIFRPFSNLCIYLLAWEDRMIYTTKGCFIFESIRERKAVLGPMTGALF